MTEGSYENRQRASVTGTSIEETVKAVMQGLPAALINATGFLKKKDDSKDEESKDQTKNTEQLEEQDSSKK